MNLVGWRERQKRIREEQEDAWREAGNVASDPGLRERYGELPRAPLRLIVCPLIKNVNHGGLLRLADAFRLEHVDFAPEENEAVDMSGQRGTRDYQPHRWVAAPEAISEAKSRGYRIVGLSLAAGAVAIERYRWKFPSALVLGSENDGVPAQALAECDDVIAIPMFGLITSLNVASAAAIVVHEAIRQYRLTAPFEPARQASRDLLR